MIYFNRGPNETEMKNFGTYKKKVTTKAMRIDGPFAVKTREGELTCQDGYLAVDSEGYPYPIAKSEFEAIYEKVD